ncbi:MAG: response regulator transcription factor [Deltaproteobacteria bacterium]|nr:response regulator transcription factor [Deltaproteobacteria bacterium]
MRVLVVEDERSLLSALQGALQAEGIDVDTAADGEEGLFKAMEGSYDVVVLDLMLPGRNGDEICAALRKKEVWVPILILTAYQGEQFEARALNVGADDFLVKPFSSLVLIARLHALVRRANGTRAMSLRVGDLEIDPARHVCLRAGTVISLTGREFSLLEMLMRRAGEVLPKQRIVDHVWGFDFDGDWNVVEVYIRYLRRKIDLPFGRQSIQTIRGVGYRLLREACELN